MPRYKPKLPENFSELCEDYPRCRGCTEYYHCDLCGTPACVWECGGDYGPDDHDLLCRMCREQVEQFKRRMPRGTNMTTKAQTARAQEWIAAGFPPNKTTEECRRPLPPLSTGAENFSQSDRGSPVRDVIDQKE